MKRATIETESSTVRKSDALILKNKYVKPFSSFLGCIFVVVLFIVWSKGSILTSSNMMIIFNQIFNTILVGSGALFIYARGEMDFSLSSIMGICSVSIAFLTRSGYSGATALAVSVILAVSASIIVGLSNIVLKIPLFLVSLSFSYIWKGLAQIVINMEGNTLYLPTGFCSFWSGWVIRSLSLIAIVSIMWLLYSKTRIGKYERAIGGNYTVALLCGVKINRLVILSHALTGVCIGAASIFSCARSGCVTAISGASLQMDVLVALVLGGIAIKGGRDCKMTSLFIGAITVAVLANGLLLVGVNQYAIEGITGLIFIIVICLSFQRTKGEIIS